MTENNSFMEIVGYALINSDADMEFAMGDKADWCGRILRVMEFNEDSNSVLCISDCGVKMAMFDYKEMSSHFKCFEQGGFLIPSTAISFTDRVLEVNRRLARTKKYDWETKKLIISTSLILGQFNDEFLF